MFNYSFEEKGDNTLEISIEGGFDTDSANKVMTDLQSYDCKEINFIVFDLSKASFMASSGLRVIFYAETRIKDDMKVEIRGAQGLVAKVLKMSGVDKLIKIV
ncbi:STAS domain-containing protein [bacterium]|nr:STAS domain-containing protein [bacterium]